MLTENGSLQLQDFTNRNFQEAFTQVTEGVWHVSGLGHSNAVVLEGNTGVSLIDTLDTLERGERLLHFIREKTGKEVKTVIFTHSHPDHRGIGRREGVVYGEHRAFTAPSTVYQEDSVSRSRPQRKHLRRRNTNGAWSYAICC